jgi:fructose-bisphosphate aldolase class II
MRKKRLCSAVNVTGSNTINGVLETAVLNAPVIIQFSNGGAQFNAESF